jgi:hypothetical protein
MHACHANGAACAHAPSLFCSQEGRITKWLQAARALRAGDGAAASDDEEEEGAEGAEPEESSAAAPCASCGRTYPHEHVRALRAGGASDTDSD